MSEAKDAPEIIVDVSNDKTYWYPTKDRFFIRTNFDNIWLLVKLVAPDHVDVYQLTHHDASTKQDTYRLVRSFVGLTKIFVPQPSKRFRGANLLLEHQQDSKYIYTFIERNVLQFSTDVPITEFYTLIGNGGCPYAYAFDERDRCYLLWNNVLLNRVPDHALDNPVQYWINESHMSFSMRVGAKKRKQEFGVNVNPNDDVKSFERYQVEDALDEIHEKRMNEVELSFGVTRVPDYDSGYSLKIPANVRDQFMTAYDNIELEIDQMDTSLLPKNDVFLQQLNPDKTKRIPIDTFQLATLDDWKAYQSMLRNRFECSPIETTEILSSRNKN